jgi:hypothetical protein
MKIIVRKIDYPSYILEFTKEIWNCKNKEQVQEILEELYDNKIRNKKK